MRLPPEAGPLRQNTLFSAMLFKSYVLADGGTICSSATDGTSIRLLQYNKKS